jgi:Lon protease-like protein
LTHYSILPAFSPSRRLYEPEAKISAEKPRALHLDPSAMEKLVVVEKIIPLFPLEVVLMPSMPLPLHIFEGRYKLMIGECLEQQREFGVIYQKGSDMKKIGCTARIVQVLKRFDDGRLDIMTQGANRFKIESINSERPYLQAKVVHFDDKPEDRTKEIDRLIIDGIDLLKQWDLLTGKTRDYGAMTALDRTTISFLLSNSDGFTPDERQKFLELTSANERIAQSVESLRKMVEHGKMTEEILSYNFY